MSQTLSSDTHLNYKNIKRKELILNFLIRFGYIIFSAPLIKWIIIDDGFKLNSLAFSLIFFVIILSIWIVMIVVIHLQSVKIKKILYTYTDQQIFKDIAPLAVFIGHLSALPYILEDPNFLWVEFIGLIILSELIIHTKRIP